MEFLNVANQMHQLGYYAGEGFQGPIHAQPNQQLDLDRHVPFLPANQEINLEQGAFHKRACKFFSFFGWEDSAKFYLDGIALVETLYRNDLVKELGGWFVLLRSVFFKSSRDELFKSIREDYETTFQRLLPYSAYSTREKERVFYEKIYKARNIYVCPALGVTGEDHQVAGREMINDILEHFEDFGVNPKCHLQVMHFLVKNCALKTLPISIFKGLEFRDVKEIYSSFAKSCSYDMPYSNAIDMVCEVELQLQDLGFSDEQREQVQKEVLLNILFSSRREDIQDWLSCFDHVTLTPKEVMQIILKKETFHRGERSSYHEEKRFLIDYGFYSLLEKEKVEVLEEVFATSDVLALMRRIKYMVKWATPEKQFNQYMLKSSSIRRLLKIGMETFSCYQTANIDVSEFLGGAVFSYLSKRHIVTRKGASHDAKYLFVAADKFSRKFNVNFDDSFLSLQNFQESNFFLVKIAACKVYLRCLDVLKEDQLRAVHKMGKSTLRDLKKLKSAGKKIKSLGDNYSLELRTFLSQTLTSYYKFIDSDLRNSFHGVEDKLSQNINNTFYAIFEELLSIPKLSSDLSNFNLL